MSEFITKNAGLFTRDEAIAEIKRLERDLEQMRAWRDEERSAFLNVSAKLRDEEERHAALQVRCFEGYPSASDGIFDALGETEIKVAELERDLAAARISISEAQARVESLEQSSTQTSSRLIHAGISSFGWNHEGVDKLAAERDEKDRLLAACYDRMNRGEVYAVQLRAALIDAKDFIEAARLAAAEYHRGWFTTAIWSIDAALAKNPNPAAEASRSSGAQYVTSGVPPDNSGSPVGLGPDGALTEDLQRLSEYLDGMEIYSFNIGAIRHSLFHPFECPWNAAVRDMTAAREKRAPHSSFNVTKEK